MKLARNVTMRYGRGREREIEIEREIGRVLWSGIPSSKFVLVISDDSREFISGFVFLVNSDISFHVARSDSLAAPLALRVFK